MATFHLLISGKVQGVFYRVSAKEKADQLGLTGWVRNRETGEVEAGVSGPLDAVEAFIEWCRLGPAGAHVTGVEVRPVQIKRMEQFSILHP